MIPVKVVTKSGALQETTIFGEKSPDYVIPLEQRGFFKESFTIHKFKSEEITSWTSTDPPPKEYGYECVKPDGAFYLFVKALESDAYKFYEKAKKHEILVVPCDDFGVSGYVRIAYCTSKDTVVNALPAFKKLAEEYKK